MSDDSAVSMPVERRLRVYAFDPSLEADLDAVDFHQTVVTIPWEPLEPGPVGISVEVVDIDPASQCVYDPVDLDHKHVLATDGLPPSDAVPQFHQQMAYAVVMKTIDTFERALGRPVLWADRTYDEDQQTYLPMAERYVPRLRIYPHAFRGENAYYSPQKKALLFGYFNSRATTASRDLPGGLIYACSSHDIIAHETTHAIVDGLQPKLLRATNDDMLALHEALGDIVAIFQHFSLRGVVRHQIRQFGGDLAFDGFLSKLAMQFGRATRSGDALRSALWAIDEATGKRMQPDPTAINRTNEPHARGAILVAAVFDAFLEIYNRRIADLRRIAADGGFNSSAGSLHPDLVERFAQEAIDLARRMLTTCVASLDYLPPVDVTFGDFLRALITADCDLFPTESPLVRLAIIQGFRDRGIYPDDVRTLTVEGLLWQPPNESGEEIFRDFIIRHRNELTIMASDSFTIPSESSESSSEESSRNLRDLRERRKDLQGRYFKALANKNHAEARRIRRHCTWLQSRENAIRVHDWLESALSQKNGSKFAEQLGFQIEIPRFQVESVRYRYQRRSDGRTRPELVVVLTQRRKVSLAPSQDKGDQSQDEVSKLPTDVDEQSIDVDGVWIRGGCTLIIDPEEAKVRYCVCKDVASRRREERTLKFHRRVLEREGLQSVRRYDFVQPKRNGALTPEAAALLYLEPLAALHGVHEE